MTTLNLKKNLLFIIAVSILFLLLKSSVEAAPVNLTTSSLSVGSATTSQGGTVEYTLTLVNTGGSTLTGITIQDTLPAGLTYDTANPATATGTAGQYAISSVVSAAPNLTWTLSAINAGATVTVKYRALVGSSVAIGTSLANSVTITGVPSPLSQTVTVATAPNYEQFLPIIFKSPPSVTLNAIPYTLGASSWTLSWSLASAQTGVTYQVQEDDNSSFSSPVLLTTTSATSYARSGASSSTGDLYYRVRAIQNGAQGPWSNIQTISFDYYDTFTSSTGWEVRRSEKSPFARSITGGNLRVTSDSAWSNVIVSPHVPAPGSNYTITTNVLMHQRQDNHHFGIVFGGKHRASGCTATSGLTTNCFEDFYLLDVQHRYVSGSSLYDPAIYEIKIDRVNYTSGNSFNRTTIKNWKNTGLNVADSHEWKIDVDTNGDFTVSANGNVLRTGTVDDPSLLNNGYFGVIVMADQNGSARTDFADFRVGSD